MTCTLHFVLKIGNCPCTRKEPLQSLIYALIYGHTDCALSIPAALRGPVVHVGWDGRRVFGAGDSSPDSIHWGTDQFGTRDGAQNRSSFGHRHPQSEHGKRRASSTQLQVRAECMALLSHDTLRASFSALTTSVIACQSCSLLVEMRQPGCLRSFADRSQSIWSMGGRRTGANFSSRATTSVDSQASFREALRTDITGEFEDPGVPHRTGCLASSSPPLPARKPMKRKVTSTAGVMFENPYATLKKELQGPFIVDAMIRDAAFCGRKGVDAIRKVGLVPGVVS